MAGTTQCSAHDESRFALVCSHLVEPAAGLGFHFTDVENHDQFPDAWCDDCELIRHAHRGWNLGSKNLVKVVPLCELCYQRARIRNTRPSVTLQDLDRLRWKCAECEEWHTGPCLDFFYNAPYYWRQKWNGTVHDARGRPGTQLHPTTFLNEDYCVIDDSDFFVRGSIVLPIIGTPQSFSWGVWGSLSRPNFEKLLQTEDEPERANLPPMFSWLSTQINEYPDTLNIKMHARIQEPGLRPLFHLEPTDHPLSLEYHHGISPERVREIMSRRLRLSR
jgi:hypothetical protein